MTAGFSGTVDEKLQQPWDGWKNCNLEGKAKNIKHFKENTGRQIIVSKMRKLYLVKVVASQPQLGPKRPCPCLYRVYLPPFPSSLPQNLSLSLTKSKWFIWISGCSVFLAMSRHKNLKWMMHIKAAVCNYHKLTHCGVNEGKVVKGICSEIHK